MHQPEQYIKPGGDIDTMTSYKKEFTPKDIAPPKAIKRNDARKVQGRFEGDPTYKCKLTRLSCSQVIVVYIIGTVAFSI